MLEVEHGVTCVVVRTVRNISLFFAITLLNLLTYLLIYLLLYLRSRLRRRFISIRQVAALSICPCQTAIGEGGYTVSVTERVDSVDARVYVQRCWSQAPIRTCSAPRSAVR